MLTFFLSFFLHLRCQELENEIQKLKAEFEVLRSRRECDSSTAPMTSSVAKVVQPTATVSSVPVSGPSKCFFISRDPQFFMLLISATGIAQSVTPGQVLRQTAIAPTSAGKVCINIYMKIYLYIYLNSIKFSDNWYWPKLSTDFHYNSCCWSC